MRYVKDNVIKTIFQVREENVDMSIPEGADMTSRGYMPLIETDPPNIEGFDAVEGGALDNELQWELRPIAAEIPQTLTPLQVKLQLLEMGLLDEVEAVVAADRKVQLYWEYASVIERDHPTLVAMAAALGLTDEQLDEMFTAASKLR